MVSVRVRRGIDPGYRYRCLGFVLFDRDRIDP